MSYQYSIERKELFTEHGQEMFVSVRDQVRHLLDAAGAFRAAKVSFVGSSWTWLACFDRMVELGEIIEVTDPTKVAGQHRVFVRGSLK